MNFRHSSQPQYTKVIQLFPGLNNLFLTSVTFLSVVSIYYFSQARPPPLRRSSFKTGTVKKFYIKTVPIKMTVKKVTNIII